MAQPHRMHLKGPWNYRWLEPPNPSAEPDRAEVLLDGDRIKMPASWQDAFGAATGRVIFSRRFQKPTNLDPEEQVHIAFDGIGGTAKIQLNDAPLGELQDVSETASINMTDRLAPTNVLSVEISFDGGDQPGGLWGAVAIEIHNAAPWD
jgi:beta-galactosidase/beta-glucuronidase